MGDARPWDKYFSEEARVLDPDKMSAQTLPEMFEQVVSRFGDNPALTTILPTGAQTTITYKELHAYAQDFARYLREDLGLGAGDTVAIMAPNCIGFCVCSLGIAMAGCVGTNVNPLYTPSELEHQLKDSNAKAIVIINLFGDKLDEVIANTGVRHVVTLSVVDFFPTLKKAVLEFVLKRVRKVVPVMSTPHTQLRTALAMGRKRAGRADMASYVQDLTGDSVALLQYTSGTTGRSKGASLTHRAVLVNTEQGRRRVTDIVREGEEVALIALPLYHITAFTLIFLSCLNIGGHGILVPRPRPAENVRSAFEKHRITWFTGINTLYAGLLAEPWFDPKLFSDIRFCASGGAAQQTGVAMKWQEATGVEILQGYGMTEVSGILTVNPPGHNKLGKVGVPVPGADVRIVDDAGADVPIGEPGEVIARTPSLMLGYLNNPEATAEVLKDGWYYTGDIGVMDEDGFLEIVDRKKDMILVSGFNVAPNEIEDVISTLPGVVQVGVVGIPDEKMGEMPVAFVVRSQEGPSEEEVLAACREQLTNYKIPRQIRFVEDVPVTLSGKVLRRQLREDHFGA